MDPQLDELYGPLLRMKFNNQKEPALPAFPQSLANGIKLHDYNLDSSVPNPTFVNTHTTPPNTSIETIIPSLVPDVEQALHEDYDFSDVVLKYISQVLMEEDEGERIHAHHDPSVVEATEKSLFEVLGQNNPPLQTKYHSYHDQLGSLHESGLSNQITYSYSDLNNGSSLMENTSCGFPYESKPESVTLYPTTSRQLSQASCSSSNSLGTQFTVYQSNLESPFSPTSNSSCLVDGPMDSPVSSVSVSDIFNNSQSVRQFQKGIEEANKFLPSSSLYRGWGRNRPPEMLIKLEASHENGSLTESRGRKHSHPELEELQSDGGRSNKQSAVSLVTDEADVRSEMFDRVLLCSGGKHDAALREALQSEKNKKVENGCQTKGSANGRGRGRKQASKRNVIDLRSLLSLCAQAVASNDQRSANDLLKQIRLHSSATGDGNQRMAHYFANGLEARLAGVGTPIYTSLMTGLASAVDMLRAYQMFLATCPYKKMANFFSNRSIMSVAEKAKKLHIIDFGIVYGFQWPCLLQRLSTRPGGPPNLRITGVDLPRPGFRPAKRLEETGRRLRNYAESFNVPFEYSAIAKKWETVTMDDLNVDSDEVLVVNCMFRLKLIPEETVTVDCPRNVVLKLMREIKPDMFIHGVVNGAYNSPFFITRFREALFHFSTQFDMLEAIQPRDTEERMLLEREIFGRQAMNALACEGLERIERPETYKQWQVRTERAGFKQLPLNRDIVDMIKRRVKSVYHKDFSIDEDGHWLLQGWKGRIVYGLTTWKPAD